MTPEVRVLLAGMSTVNSELSRYILRCLDVQNGLTEAGFSTEREGALGRQMVGLGEALQALAGERRQTADGTASPSADCKDHLESEMPQP